MVSPTLAASPFDLLIQEMPCGLRIVTPPLRYWKNLPKGYRIGMMVLLVFTLFSTIAFTQRPFDYSGLIPLFEYSIVLLFLALYAWHMLRRRIIIDVTNTDVFVHYVSPAHRVRTMSWQRRNITELRASEISHRLMIRAVDRDMQEIYLGSDEITRQVATKLQEALPISFAAPSPSANFKQVGRPFAEPQLASALFKISYAAFVAGLLVLLVGHGWGGAFVVAGCLIFTIAAGIANGTQEKFFT